MKSVYQPILEAIFAASGYTIENLAGKSRRRPLPHYRKIFCLLCTEAGMSCLQVGKMIRRDHSTVLFCLRSFKVSRKYDPVLFRLLDEVNKHLTKIMKAMDNNNLPVGKSDCEQWYKQNKNDHQFLKEMRGYLRQHNAVQAEQMINDWMDELRKKIEVYEKENNKEKQ